MLQSCILMIKKYVGSPPSNSVSGASLLNACLLSGPWEIWLDMRLWRAQFWIDRGKVMRLKCRFLHFTPMMNGDPSLGSQSAKMSFP